MFVFIISVSSSSQLRKMYECLTVGSPHGVTVKVLACSHKVKEFKFQ